MKRLRGFTHDPHTSLPHPGFAQGLHSVYPESPIGPAWLLSWDLVHGPGGADLGPGKPARSALSITGWVKLCLFSVVTSNCSSSAGDPGHCSAALWGACGHHCRLTDTLTLPLGPLGCILLWLRPKCLLEARVSQVNAHRPEAMRRPSSDLRNRIFWNPHSAYCECSFKMWT